MRDREGRLRQADKIAYLLSRFGLPREQMAAATCLDLGCSSGTITSALAPLFDRMIGLDYDELALRHAERSLLGLAWFARGDAMHLPIAAASIDVVLCAQVYEHVPDDTLLAAEVHRVLKPGGRVFFSGPNKLFPIELHYRLPFVHWLPGWLADRYMRITGHGDHYYERSRTLWGLRRLLAQFVIRDVSVDVVTHRLRSAPAGMGSRILRLVPRWIWRLMLPFLPNYNWILFKVEGRPSGTPDSK